MADVPVPRSFQSTLGDLIDAFRSKQGVPTLKVGSGVLSTLEAAAQSDMRSSQDTFDLVNATSIDNAEGLALERKGKDEKVPKLQESAASGLVDISDTSFVKTSSKLFQGLAAPIVGSTTINLVDGTGWPSTGQVYLGRGTANYEGPLAYTSVTNVGTHWVLALSAGTVKFHNTSETAVLAQGGLRSIGVNSIVRTPQANVADAVEFKVLYPAGIPDGETIVRGVQVAALKNGTIGNVAKGQIKEFASEPFSGAVVTNPAPFSNGRATETDDDYRERIKAAIASRALGTPLAITTSVTGITASDENKRISSASFVKRTGLASTLYIDDGTGYEARTAGVAVESIVDSAIGGEQFLNVNNRPIARAFALTTNAAPFALATGAVLRVRVGGVEYIHPFSMTDFVAIDNATAYECVASINANSSLGFLARTVAAGTQFAIFAKVDTNEDIEVLPATGVDANDAFAFPVGVNYTLQLYLNDRLLTKDGSKAVLSSQGFSTWNTFSGSQTLILSVDGTPAVTYTFTDQDFINANTGFSTLGRNSLAAWVAVINAKIPGVTASTNGAVLFLTSNAGTSARAGLNITGGTLISAHMFSVASILGTPSDYTVDRNEGQIALQTPLSPGDRLTIGSKSSRAFVESDVIPATTLASQGRFWFVVDGGAQIIPHGVTSSTTFNIAVSKLHDWGHKITITATSGTPFANLQIGDWAILWDPAIPVPLQGAHRLASVSSTVLTIERRDGLMLRAGHRATALAPVGAALCKVLITGGTTQPRSALTSVPTGVTASCAIYDPNTQTTQAVTSMNHARAFHTATLLQDGRVLVTGGLDDTGAPVNSMELYDPTANTWTTSNVTLAAAEAYHSANLLTNGKVLIVGGSSTATGAGTTLAQLYTPSGDTIATTGALTNPRSRHRSLVLPSGNVLIVGGQNSGTERSSCEIYSVGGGSFTLTGSMHTARADFGLAAIGTSPSSILAVGDAAGSGGTTSYEVYDISGGTWGTSTTIPSNFVFESKNAITGTDGTVRMFHGRVHISGPVYSASSMSFDGTTWTTVAANALQTDTITKFESHYVTIQNASISETNHIAAIGGSEKLTSAWGFLPTSQIEEWHSGTWTVPEPATSTGLTLSNLGMSFVRTNGLVQEADIAAATNYTATTIVGVLNPELQGATATVYRTNRVRVATNTYALGGDIALVAQDNVAQPLKLTAGGAVENLASHTGAVESGNSELGTPSFDAFRVRGVAKNTGSLQDLLVTDVAAATVNLGYGLVGLRDFWGGTDGTSTYAFTQSFYKRYGSNYGFRSRLLSQAADGTHLVDLGARVAPVRPWAPLDRFYLAAPYAISPNDDLTVVADNDVTKRYAIHAARKLATVGSTYSSTNTFRDADAAGVSLAKTFGLGYDFNDFAVFMSSRAIAFPATPTAKTLIRYTRPGPDGDGVRVRFSNPVAPNGALSVGLTYGPNVTTDVRVQLAGGAARTPTVHSTTKVGVAMYSISGNDMGNLIYVLALHIASAARTTNVTTLTLDNAVGTSDHGLNVSDTVWVTSNDVNFSAGLKTITSRTATTISYAETAANATGTTIGTVSNDTQGEATFNGSGFTIGDFFRINDPGNVWADPSFVNNTVMATAVSTSGGSITAQSGENAGSSFVGVTTTLHWTTLGLATNLQLFANPAQPANTIIAGVNAFAAATNPTCPITMFALGNGTGAIDRSSPEAANDANAWYTLSDGVNWVASTTSPGSTAGDYQLTFKNPINGALATGSDWVDEVVYIAPTTALNVVEWLNTPTVSGLFTACSVQASSAGTKVQIASNTPGSAGGVQVQGGLANSATASIVGSPQFLGQFGSRIASTVHRSDADGLMVGMWCSIQNQTTVPKASVFSSSTALTSWSSAGLMHFSSSTATLYVEGFPAQQMKVQIERQGRYIAVSDLSLAGSGGGSFGSLVPGSWLRLSPSGSPTGGVAQISSANQGVFRVVRVAGALDGLGTIWIENDAGLEETVEGTLAVYTPNSVMPGDTMVISTPIFGAANQGTWTVQSVGSPTGGTSDQFTNGDYLLLAAAGRTVTVQGATATLGSSSSLVQIVEGTPAKFLMRINGIAPNQTDGSYLDLRWDQGLPASNIGESAGSVITALDKLGFSSNYAAGVDGYAYDTGLLGEANKVVYGDPADTTTYPGVASANANINIEGPLVKRIFVSLSLRVRSGVPNADVADRVRSAVATVINQTPHGTSIAFSDIITAAGRVKGVVTVSIVSPTYSAGSDQIPVQLWEKPLVLNLDTDIQVSFTGD